MAGTVSTRAVVAVANMLMELWAAHRLCGGQSLALPLARLLTRNQLSPVLHGTFDAMEHWRKLIPCCFARRAGVFFRALGP